MHAPPAPHPCLLVRLALAAKLGRLGVGERPVGGHGREGRGEVGHRVRLEAQAAPVLAHRLLLRAARRLQRSLLLRLDQGHLLLHQRVKHLALRSAHLGGQRGLLRHRERRLALLGLEGHAAPHGPRPELCLPALLLLLLLHQAGEGGAELLVPHLAAQREGLGHGEGLGVGPVRHHGHVGAAGQQLRLHLARHGGRLLLLRQLGLQA
mmetsp:Transcript_24727/g.62785  ORF Transcript_24727/g.62785 Transcript_24727/m.62785 type:complete len:208 (+) Transcript_24727:345-968(+)